MNKQVETIRAEIERLKERAAAERVLHPQTILAAKNYLLIKDYDNLLAFLDTIAEQPKPKPMNIPSAGGGMSTTPPKFKLDVKPEQLIGLDDENAADKKAVKEIVKTVHKEVTRQVKEMLERQPVEGLEREIIRYKVPFLDEREYLNEGTLDAIARHFYELGCCRTAEMYDDIEYKRQRAEEVEITNNLEEELENYAKLYPFEDAGSYRNLITLARHFAEWGAEHAKK